jgi:hypothetical protein
MSKTQQQIGQYKTVVLADDGKTKVVYYETAVVTFDNDTIILDTGGWETRSTKTRMNQASRQFDLGYQVRQVRGKWVITFRRESHPYDTERVRLDRLTGRVTPLK